MRSRRRLIFFLIVIVLFLALGVGAYFLVRSVRAQYENQLERQNQHLASATNRVYVATMDILPGIVIQGDMVKTEETLIENTVGLFTEDDIGKISTVSVSSGQIMYKSFATDQFAKTSTRSVEYGCFYVPSDARQGDFIDVRIRYINGEEMVVLAKERIEKVSESGTTVFLNLTEEEQQYMASAQYDVLNHGAKLYATVYTEIASDNASAVTYVPSLGTIRSLINCGFEEYRDEAYALKREKLEARLGDDNKKILTPDNISQDDVVNVNGDRSD